MSVHLRLVLPLILAVQGYRVTASRIQRLKDTLDPVDEEADLKQASLTAALTAARNHSAGNQVKLTHPLPQAAHSSEGASLVEDKANSSEGASLVQDKANSTHALLLSDNSSVYDKEEAHKADSTYAQRLASIGALVQPLARKWKKHVIVGITGLVVLAFCFGYCLFDHLFCQRKGKGSRNDEKKKWSADTKKVTFERKPYVYEGREVFDWEQSASSIKLFVTVPKHLTKNDLEIKIGNHHLQIGCVGKEPFMKEEVYDNVNVEDSGWRLRSNGELQIMLQKGDSSVWPRVLK